MELFKTEQILWEKTYSKSLLLEIKLKPWPQKVTEVVPGWLLCAMNGRIIPSLPLPICA